MVETVKAVKILKFKKRKRKTEYLPESESESKSKDDIFSRARKMMDTRLRQDKKRIVKTRDAWACMILGPEKAVKKELIQEVMSFLWELLPEAWGCAVYYCDCDGGGWEDWKGWRGDCAKSGHKCQCRQSVDAVCENRQVGVQIFKMFRL